MNAEELCGKVLGTCTLQKVIGRGGMGAVYLAQQSRPRRQVAVKVLLPITTFQPHQHKAFLERFRRETDAAASLEHPNITPVHEYGELDGLAYLVMPYVSGGTLRDELDAEGKLPLTRIISYLEQMAAAIDFAHERKVVHRDIKPANILMTPEKRLLLTDFGLVKIITDGQKSLNPLSEVGMPMGTPDYMSPEQVIGGEVDARADIYSLGILLYHMVAGTPPFQGEAPMKVALQHLHTMPPPPRTQRPDLPPAAEQVILRAIAKRPNDRYACARDLASAFRLTLEDAGVQVDGQGGSSEDRGAGNRRRGLFDPVWRSPMPTSAPQTPAPIPARPTFGRSEQQQIPAAANPKPAVAPAQTESIASSRRDIVAQTSMTMPSFSGILTTADMPMGASAKGQPSALPSHGTLLGRDFIQQTPPKVAAPAALTPLPPTLTQAPAVTAQNAITPLPPVHYSSERETGFQQADPHTELETMPTAEASQKSLFSPPKLKLRLKTNLHSIQKGQTMPNRAISAQQLQTQQKKTEAHSGQSEISYKEPTTRQFGPATNMSPGSGMTGALARSSGNTDKQNGKPPQPPYAGRVPNIDISPESTGTLPLVTPLLIWLERVKKNPQVARLLAFVTIWLEHIKKNQKVALIIALVLVILFGILILMLSQQAAASASLHVQPHGSAMQIQLRAAHTNDAHVTVWRGMRSQKEPNFLLL